MRGFGSDNFAGVHPKILQAICEAGKDHAIAYGKDDYTREVQEVFKQQFGDCIAYLVFNGTAANVLGISAVTKAHNSIICGSTSHLHMHECGAVEKFTGCKVLPVSTVNGKLTIEAITNELYDLGDVHHSQPKVISITQATEIGTIYSIKELKEIANFAHKKGLFLHVDGARLSNAAVALNTSLKALTKDVGVDVLSLGGTKNGMLFGDAVIFFNKNLSTDFDYIRKQSMQLASKMRFISVQFQALLSNDLWMENARHSNSLAQDLASKLSNFPGVRITRSVETNAVFVTLPRQIIPKLQKRSFFYIWDEPKGEVRLMTSFDSTQKDIDEFVAEVKRVLG
ncbi:low specificity L-threonine aldolase [Candidatus Micrarchaeota archaeon]|nr:low specificity L-threonine aldolase [Candidatus Micrarchaeota archaeon]